MLIYGIGAAQVPDKAEEVLDLQGLDVSEMRYLNDEHGSRLSDMIGAVKKYKKIFTEKDVQGDWQKRCWDEVKAPFLYFEGEILEDPEHEDAKAARSLMRYTNAHPELPLKVGASIEGAILARGGPEKTPEHKYLQRSLGKGISLTVAPCNPKCRVFMAQDLMKSIAPSVLPEKYLQRLADPTLTPAIRDSRLLALQAEVEKLHKSVQSLFGQFTELSCRHCGHSERLFKSSNQWPNCCPNPNCQERFTMKDLYKALTK